MLKQGLTGNEVAALQFALNRAAPQVQPTKSLVCDGIFGPLTFARVIDHQQRAKLSPDGIAGPLTLGSLFRVARLRTTIQVAATDPPRGSAPPFLALAPRNGMALRPLPPPGLDPPRTPTRRAPNMADWLNPTLAEMARQQEAFRAWWDSPHPKPPLPAPKPYPPPIRWDLLFPEYAGIWQTPRHEMVITPPQDTRRNVAVDRKGMEVSLKVEGGGELPPPDPLKPRRPKWKIFELEVELKALLVKNRYAALSGGGSISAERDEKHMGWKAKGFLQVSPGKLDIFTERLTLESATELSAAVALEVAMLAAELELKRKAELQLLLIRGPGETGLSVGVGVGVGGRIKFPIWSKHPGRDPDEEKVKVSPLVEGFMNFTYRFQ